MSSRSRIVVGRDLKLEFSKVPVSVFELDVSGLSH